MAKEKDMSTHAQGDCVEDNEFHQDCIEKFERSIPVPSTSKDAFFPVKERKHGISYSNLKERMKYYNIPGVSIACIRDYKFQWAKGYGVTKINEKQEVTPTTIFEAASTTKFINTILILRLVEEGLLSLSEDVNNYLRSWKIPENEFTSVHPVTLTALLTHKAGFPPTNFPWEEGSNPTILDVLKGRSPAMNAAVQVQYVPGTRFEYSNLDHVVIQLVLEEIFYKSYSTIMAEKVFQPLKLSHSYIAGHNKVESYHPIAFPHDKEGTLRMPYRHPSALAQGGLLTTPSDLARVAIDIMCAYNGEPDRYLSQKSVSLLFENHGDLGDTMLGIPINGGLGCFIHRKGDEFMFTHPGYNNPGMLSYFYGYPKSGHGGVVMINGENGEKLAYEIIHGLNLLQ